MQQILTALGKDCVMFIDAGELPLPHGVPVPAADGLVSAPPADLDERTIVFLDCGNLERNPAARRCSGRAAHILNIDHHHDNTRFGTVNLVVPDASCTAEIVWDLMRGLGVEPTLTIAEALYVGLITDTGRFMYENTGARAHLMAAELIEAGVDVHEIYRRVYEGVPYGKLALLARGLANVERYDEGRLTVTALSAEDFSGVGRRGELLRRRDRPPARGPGDRGRGARPRPDRRGGRRNACARSRCAPATTASTSRRSRGPRAAAATARPPASPPRWAGTSWSSSCARRSRSS